MARGWGGVVIACIGDRGRPHCRPACKTFGSGIAESEFHVAARGEFSIIIASLAQAGGLLAIVQPFSALYVLILASVSPLLAKESERVYDVVMKLVRWRPKRKRRVEDVNEENVDESVES